MSPLRRSDSFRFSAISRFSRLTSEEIGARYDAFQDLTRVEA